MSSTLQNTSKGSQAWLYSEPLIAFYIESKRYDEALKLIQQFSLEDPILICSAAECYIGSKEYQSALDLLIDSERKGWNIPPILRLKGKALYMLGEYETAKRAFEESESLLSEPDNHFWIQRCIVRISMQNEELPRRVVRYELQVSDTEKT